MTDYLALLRGINVGGNTKVPMDDLKVALEEDGFERLETYLQTGNIIFSSPRSDPTGEAERLRMRIHANFGVTTAVVVRTRADLEQTLLHNPYLADEPEFKWLHVMFLDRVPDAEAIAELDPDRSPGDRFHIFDRDIYLHYPNGSARSKLTIDYFERVLKVTATSRNWNTVTKLQQKMSNRS